ncbi:reverse transcriptase domain-containing protein [Trichonephila clavipes]|nr:reverse transcriptase domain-containing protein [Trichonephila clavipes]
MLISKYRTLKSKKVDLPTYLGVTLDPELRFSKHIEQTTNKALGKLNVLRKLCGTSWGSRPQTLKSTFCTVIRPVLEYATPIWTPASISVKRKLDSVQHRAAKIIIGAVSSTNNEKAEQECGLPPLESRRKLATIKFTNKLRSYGAPHSKKPTKEYLFLNWNCCSHVPKKRRPCNSQTKGLETIAILSQDNFAIAYTDGSSDRSLSNGGAGIILLLPDVTEFDCPRIITSTIARLRTEHLKGMKIHPDKTRSYVQCKHCPDLQLTPNHILECSNRRNKVTKNGMVPLRDSLWELYTALMLPE